jgi:hypothetical protein
MSSSKKVAAKWTNGRKSFGPRTGTGKARSSGNARRHEMPHLAATTRRYRA